MFLIISNDKNKLSKALKSLTSPIFAYFKSTNALEAPFSYRLPIKAVLIDSPQDIESAKKLCAEIRSQFPSASVGVILNESQIKTSLFRYLPEADAELISPFSNAELADFLQRLHTETFTFVSPSLICAPSGFLLLGYKLKLSPAENRILLFLSVFCRHTINADDILAACLNSSAGIETVRVLISRINQKAKNISGRPLILRSAEKGYYLNPEA